MDLKCFKIIKNYYENSKMVIRNDDDETEQLKTTIGVKQGGPLSPRLFAMYTEDLINQIEKTTHGIRIKEMKIDIIMYADDVILLANKLEDLEQMLEITEKYGKENEIKFNPTKTTYMIFTSTKKIENRHPRFDGTELKRVKSMRYLGYMINDKITNVDHVKTRKKLAIISSVGLNKYGYNNKLMNPMLKSSLYKCYSRSVLLYGMENVILRKNEIKQLQTIEAKMVKRSLKISYRTRNTKILHALNIEPIEIRDIYLKCKFFIRLVQNDYTKSLINNLVDYYCERGSFYKDSIINQIIKILNTEYFDEDMIIQSLHDKMREMDIENQNMQSDDVVKQLKELLSSNKNTDATQASIQALIKAF
jgi:hypothetical protein